MSRVGCAKERFHCATVLDRYSPRGLPSDAKLALSGLRIKYLFLPLLPKEGLAEFLRRCDQAELNAYDDLGTVRQAQNASLRLLERRAKRLGASESEIRKFMLGLLNGAF